MRYRSKKQTRKLFFIFIGILSFMMLFSKLTYQNIQKLLYTEILKAVSSLTKREAGQLEAELKGNINGVKYLAQFINHHIEEKPYDEKNFLLYTKNFKKDNNYEDVYLVDKKGNAYLYGEEIINIQDRNYFEYGMKGNHFISTPVIEKIKGELVLVFGSPIYQNGKVEGLVIATKKLENLYVPFSIPFYGEEGKTYVVDAEGNLLLAPISSLSQLSETNIFSRLEADSSDIEEIKETLQKKKGWTGMIPYAGEPCYLCFSPVEISHSGISDWYMVSVIRQKNLMQNSQKVLYYTVALCLIITCSIIAAAGAIWYSHKKYRQHVEYLAYHDELTGLYASIYLKEHGYRIMNNSDKSTSFAYVAFDIDKFKLFNEIFGYEKGNYLLQLIGRVLKEHINSEEIPVRIGNDTFGLLLHFETRSVLQKRLQLLEKKFITTCQLEGLECGKINFSFGIYIISETTLSFDKIMDYADIARKQVKKNAIKNIEFFNSDILKQLKEEQRIEDIMETALKKGEFVPFIQPKVNMVNSRVVGGEALVRWVEPSGKIIPPSVFVTLFERNGFITQVDYYIFEEVCKKIAEWKETKGMDFIISVNMSRNHLHQEDFVETLCVIADKYHVEHQLLEIEMTENIYFNDVDLMMKVIHQLKEAKFQISMDDFGSGYSSLNLLKELPIDVLKIDGGFLNETQLSEKGENILRSVIEMAERIHVDVICEGVETEKQVKFLTSIGCRKAQGYYYSKPVPVEQFEEYCIPKFAG